MISVIISVYNVEDYLPICINSILNQSYEDFEIICIDDASTDSSLEMLKYFSQKDSRVKLIENEESKGLASCQKIGMEYCKGKYVLFLNGKDWIASDAFDKFIDAAEGNNLDLLMFKSIAFSYDNYDLDINDYLDVNFLDDFDSEVFTCNDLDKIMKIAMFFSPLKKLYLKSFLERMDLSYLNDDINVSDEKFLYELSQADCKISFLNEFLYINQYEVFSEKDFICKKLEILNKIIKEFLPVISLNNYDLTKIQPLLAFSMFNNLEDLLIKKNLLDYFNSSFILFKLLKIKECFDNCDEEYKIEFYQEFRKEFINIKLDSNILNNVPFELYKFYITVLNNREYKKYSLFNNHVKKKYDYIDKRKLTVEMKDFKEMGINKGKRKESVIVSLTSFPERILDVHFCIYSLLNQTLKPDKVILWLADDQFPNKEKDIPENVLNLKKNGLSIKWCDDLKPYKKLIPALKEYPNDFIITVDDDIFYPEDWLETMWNTYEKYPKTIISSRLRTIKLNENNMVENYTKWYLARDFKEPSFLNFPTGAGGILYFPHALSDNVFEEDLFKNLCPTGDDIWFWGMAILNETKITGIEKPFEPLNYVNIVREMGINDDFTLWSYNRNGQNEKQFKNLVKHFPEILNIITKE